ncbi:MAG: hypothetical protein LBM63_01670 [Rikenellaceae bacterium]|jgi:hypothetical protein|nr:hypothetical protein [Rikenellaceae bacterium]
MAENKIFRAEVRSRFAEWWRYNVFMTVACYDEGGQTSDYLNLADKVYETGDGTEARTAPADYNPARPLVLETPPCHHAELFVYVIANTFPSSTTIKDSPPFELEVLSSAGGEKPVSTLYPVNQWGGLALKQSLG